MAEARGWWLRTVQAPRTIRSRCRDLLLSWLGSTPYQVLAARDRRLQAGVGEGLREFRPRIVQAELLPAAQFLGQARATGVPTVYSAHNVESRIVAGMADAARRPWRRLAGERMRRHEVAQATLADAVAAVSTQEAAWFEPVARKVVVIPNALELERYEYQPPARQSVCHLLFTGHLGYPPNRDAARMLAKEVLPLVRHEMPDIRCRIAGTSPAADVRSLAGEGVEIMADFADFASLGRESIVFVSALRWGAGSRLKLLEAAAVGLPIVATPFSAEGLSLRPGRDYLEGSSPEELAAAVLLLLREPARRHEMAQEARSTVEAFHDWARQRETIERFYASLLDHPGPG